jgi:predicted 2-oxoglutarate/Fe(II)-dependent dioxygenase YbiX
MVELAKRKVVMATQINGLFPGELYPNVTVGGCIDIFENAWPNPQETIELLEKECSDPESGLAWHRAETIGQGINQSARTNYDIAISYTAQETGNALAQNIHNQMYIMLLAATIPYARKHDVDEMYHENYNVLRYRTGQEYKPHSDGSTESGRAISAICYWNDDYKGGEIEFPNFDIKIKPEPGMLLLFPSSYPYKHVAHPVKEGTKYAIVTWIHDRPL